MATICLHCVALPTAIALTFWYYQGLVDNQQRWTCVPIAQVALATLYLAYGPGALLLRFSLASLSITVIVISTVWADSVIRFYEHFWFPLNLYLAHIMAPALLSGLFLSVFRPWVGIVSWNNSHHAPRLGVLDLLTATCCCGAVFSLYRLTSPESTITFKDIASDLPFTSLSTICGVSCLLLFMGRRTLKRVAGGIGITVGLAVWCSLSPWPLCLEMIDPWLVVSATLIMLRIAGLSLASTNQDSGELECPV